MISWPDHGGELSRRRKHQLACHRIWCHHPRSPQFAADGEAIRPAPARPRRRLAGAGSAAARARAAGAEERVPGVGSGVTAEAMAGTVARSPVRPDHPGETAALPAGSTAPRSVTG